MEQTYIYADQGSGLSRIGLRATNLSSQLQTKKKYKNKTQSIMMLNSNFSKSRGQLDGISVKSGNSTDMLSYNPQQQQLAIPKQRYRESFMYLNANNQQPPQSYQQYQQPPPPPPQQQQQQSRFNGSPELLQRRFSSQNGGAGIGSPMVYHSEEQARKISLNALIGVPSDEGINETSFMEQDWISIDEEEEDQHTTKTNETITRLQLENRNLKKKLKDIELGHDSNSIVANDEHYTRLEEQYNELSQNFDLMEFETKNLIEQNDAYFKEMTRLKKELDKVNNSNDRLLELFNSIINSAPRYINDKSNFNKLFSIVQENELLKKSFNNSLNTYNNTESNGNNHDIIKMLQFELRGLHESNKSLRTLLKNSDNINAQKLSLERRTITVAATQSSLHNEFHNSHQDFKNRWFNKIPTISIVPSSEATTTTTTTLPAPSPQTPLSHSMHSLNSVVSRSTDDSEPEFHSIHSSVKSPLDIQYETFT